MCWSRRVAPRRRKDDAVGWRALSWRRAWPRPHPRPSPTQGVPPGGSHSVRPRSAQVSRPRRASDRRSPARCTARRVPRWETFGRRTRPAPPTFGHQAIRLIASPRIPTMASGLTPRPGGFGHALPHAHHSAVDGDRRGRWPDPRPPSWAHRRPGGLARPTCRPLRAGCRYGVRVALKGHWTKPLRGRETPRLRPPVDSTSCPTFCSVPCRRRATFLSPECLRPCHS
jgi:hypothetical protein